MPDVVTLLSRPLFGVTRSTTVTTALLTDGLLVPEGTAIVPSVIELQQTTINTGTAGKKFEHAFELRVPYSISLVSRLRVHMGWEVVDVASAVFVCTGRWGLSIKKRSVAGVVSDLALEVFATERALGNGIVLGQVYAESNFTIDIPACALSAGETIQVILSFNIVQPTAGSLLAITLTCDPSTPADAVICEFDVGAP